jgi:hypothetical protein
VALFDNVFELLHTAGGYVGAGGGLVAGELYRRFRSSVKDAKDAKKLVEALVSKIEHDLEPRLSSFVTKEAFAADIARLMRGSRPESLPTDQAVLQRLTELERRMAGVEDDIDQSKKEDRTWAENIRETLGRIEGQLNNR